MNPWDAVFAPSNSAVVDLTQVLSGLATGVLGLVCVVIIIKHIAVSSQGHMGHQEGSLGQALMKPGIAFAVLLSVTAIITAIKSYF